MSSLTAAKKLLMASAGGKKSTYVDDVFSTYLYRGNATARSINNGIDLSGEGGLVWVKNREIASDHILSDTVRGSDYYIRSNSNVAQTDDVRVTAFNNNGFSVGTAGEVNQDTKQIASWTFREQKGFFDIVTYTGTGSAHSIAHSLGCVPGCIMVKCTSQAENWQVYHSGMAAGTANNAGKYGMNLNSVGDRDDPNSTYWNDTDPTATEFTVGTQGTVNSNGASYVAYLFAGANATRWSDMLSPASGTFDFPAERAFNGKIESHPTRLRTSGNHILVTMTISPAITVQAGQSVVIYGEDAAIGNPYNYSGTATVTIDGTTYTSSTGDTHTFNHSGQLTQITYRNNSTGGRTYLEGIRVNGDLLTDGSFFVNGNPNYTAGEESKFGEDEDQSMIKCGSYRGTGADNIINVGWQPQWVMIKNCEGATKAWYILDSMRGFITGGDDKYVEANDVQQESTYNFGRLTSTGFALETNDDMYNENDDEYIYIAIRFPDGYVGKPAEAGTDVFAMDTGNSSTTIPNFDSNFPVDLALVREPGGTSSWNTSGRLMAKNYVDTDSSSAQQAWVIMTFDSNLGWNFKGDWGSEMQSWMWKRRAGFDVVCYKGNGATQAQGGQIINHSLSKIPEMIWVKCRTDGEQWGVYHKGLNGGTNPEQYNLILNLMNVEANNAAYWNDTAPTSSYFTVGDENAVNKNNEDYISMLFASVDGISKCGYYTGTGSAGNAQTTAFLPRLLIIKRVDTDANWYLFDSLRGLHTTSQYELYLDTTGTGNPRNFFTTSSTGFAFVDDNQNTSGGKYIYYAHA